MRTDSPDPTGKGNPEMCDVCDLRAQGFTQEQAQAMVEQNMIDTIHLYGISLTGVPDAEPPFVYSAGRTLLDLPELYMTGYARIDQLAGTINRVHAAQIDDGIHIHEGDRLDGMFPGTDFPLAITQVDPSRSGMTQTLELFRDLPTVVRAWQLVWPDNDGRFPWDDGYDPVKFEQPIHRIGQPS